MTGGRRPPDPSRPSSLRRCTGDTGAFLRDVWGRRAAVSRRRDPEGFADLLSFEDVDRILATTSLRTPAFRLVRGGAQIPEAEYTRSGRTGSKPVSGMVDPARVFALFEAGATIVLQGVHRYWEPVSRFLRDLELELGHACQVNAYVTPPGAQGLGLHADPHDVFVLQAFGRKRWAIHAAPREARGEPIEADIETGDTIYMPTGTPHAASTQESLSGHLTVGVHVTTWRQVVDEAWRRVAVGAELERGIPAGWLDDPSALAEELRARLGSLASALGSTDPAELVRAREERFLTTRPPLLRGALVDRLEAGAIDDGTILRRRAGALCELRVRGEELHVLLGDRRLVMPAWLEGAMRRIAGADELKVDELAGDIHDTESRAVLARRLVREGLLTLDRGR